jgi:hypothetical protein
VPFWRDCLDDDQPSAATRARKRECSWRLISIAEVVIFGAILDWRHGREQVSDPGDIGGPGAVSEEPIMADTVLAFGEHVDQEPTDELNRL